METSGNNLKRSAKNIIPKFENNSTKENIIK